MPNSQAASFIRDHQLDAMRIAGKKVGAGRDRAIEVFNPATNARIGTVPKATLDEVRLAYEAAHAFQPKLTRYERAAILNKAAAIIR
ncbi:MAG: aldehyde dehydrogenase family protein, partial [Ramlibacter sp.]